MAIGLVADWLWISTEMGSRSIPIKFLRSPQNVELSGIIHADSNPISLAESHRESEHLIAASGIPHAILRNSWYIDNYLIGADAAIAHGVLLGSTGNRPISAATRADYATAAAAAVVLTGAVGPNHVYELAGDRHGPVCRLDGAERADDAA